jgi:hypothetical protein
MKLKGEYIKLRTKDVPASEQKRAEEVVIKAMEREQEQEKDNMLDK